MTISRSERLNFERFIEADEVADYETWRLAQDSMTDPEVLLEQGTFRAGQLSGGDLVFRRATFASVIQIAGAAVCKRKYLSSDNTGRRWRMNFPAAKTTP